MNHHQIIKKPTDKKDISENKQKIKEDTLSHDVGIIDPESENEDVTIMETKKLALNARISQDIEEVKESETTTDLSDAWIIDDVGTMDSESEEENKRSAETNDFLVDIHTKSLMKFVTLIPL